MQDMGGENVEDDDDNDGGGDERFWRRGRPLSRRSLFFFCRSNQLMSRGSLMENEALPLIFVFISHLGPFHPSAPT